MSEITDLVVIEKSTALEVFKSSDSVEDIISKVEREVNSFVADVNTNKGRKDIASMAYKVAQSKTYLDGLGKDLVAELKEVPKLIDANRKTVRDRLDALRDKVRQPLTEWEAGQERIKVEEEAKRAAEELAKQVEVDHEIALLLNDKFDRDLLEAQQEAERQRIAHEEELKRQAAEQAKREEAEAAQREIDAAAAREREALLAKERAEREAREAAEQAERNRIAAEQRAEREKQEAIEAERRKAQEEADRIKREADAKESARLAEQKRIADEQAKREADVKHRKAIGTAVVNALIEQSGITREQAIAVLGAIINNTIPHTRITY
ncbi:coiled-coil domain-containing protein [Pectobacterium versatile]|uniref:cell envelope biogenesis protein TolA n=1 Tax=Pectobacterium versatile TaxID=2488639 RepID=UPI001F3326EF|nr:cell envelope biogenesis protein TolA [Pectobacterium versatile]